MKKVFKYSMENISKVQKKLPKFAGDIFVTYSETSWTSTSKISFLLFFHFLIILAEGEEMFLIYSIDLGYFWEVSVELFSQTKWPSISISPWMFHASFFYRKRSFSILRHFEQKLKKGSRAVTSWELMLLTNIITNFHHNQTFLTYFSQPWFLMKNLQSGYLWQCMWPRSKPLLSLIY